MVAPLNPRDLWGPNGPYYKGHSKQPDSKPEPGTHLKNLLEKLGLGGLLSGNTEGLDPSGLKITKQPTDAGTYETSGPTQGSPHIVHVTSLQGCLEKLAELVGYKPSKNIQDHAEGISEAQKLLTKALTDAGLPAEVTATPPEMIDTKLIGAAMEGVSKLTAMSALGGRGLSALRWLLQNAVISDPEDPTGSALNYHREVTKAKQRIRKYCDQHKQALGTRSGRFAYAAVALCGGDGGDSDADEVTVLQAAVYFAAAYELERKIDSRTEEHTPAPKSSKPQPGSENPGSDTDTQAGPSEGYQG